MAGTVFPCLSGPQRCYLGKLIQFYPFKFFDWYCSLKYDYRMINSNLGLKVVEALNSLV